MSNAAAIQIRDYNPEWPQHFQALKVVLADVLGCLVLDIEHIGSTAVPGLAAKPILDVDVIIASNTLLPAVTMCLTPSGYCHQGNLGIIGRESFGRAADDVPRNGSKRRWPLHHLYVCSQDSQELARHLALRDYFRQHPDQALAYGHLKQRLAQHFGTDREAYTQAKTAFIEAIYQQILR